MVTLLRDNKLSFLSERITSAGIRLHQIGSNILFLFDSELLLERFGHGWWRRAGKAKGDLDTVIDKPLKGGKGTDHNDTGAQSLPDTFESHFFEN